MTSNRLLKALILCPILLFAAIISQAQTKTITGKITDEKGKPVVGASVTTKGGKGGTITDAAGNFTINAPSSASKVTVSYVGYGTQDVDVSSASDVAISLNPDNSTLTDVVVIGYGTVRKKDLTGSVASVSEKNFNKGVYASADQLLQGRAAGIQVTNTNGSPGANTTVKIRGNATITGTGNPLYVIDGVPLDNGNPSPGIDVGLGGSGPGNNPLNFINPNDIASVDILKDASATAIYGSRGAYGVVNITTKKGKTGQPKLDASGSVGFAKIEHRINVLDANQFRQALTYYGLPATLDKGGNVNALDAILRTGTVQNYNASINAGNENGRYRLSMGYLDQEGIILKSGLKKYSANFNGSFNFLNKRIGLDINILPSQYLQDIVPVTARAGAENSLVGQALTWNPTQPLTVGDSIVNIGGNSVFNPLGVSNAINDKSKVTTILASIAPSFKFTDWLTYKFQFSINYATGVTRFSRDQNINLGANTTYTGLGTAGIAQSEAYNSQYTHTLTFNKDVAANLNLNVLAGYEYLKFVSKGYGLGTTGPSGGYGQYGLDYTNYLQYSDPAARTVYSYNNPTTELQSYFGRVAFNYAGKYLLTVTMRADGSTKFGANNRYGYFPSFAVGWDVAKEDFFKGITAINSLKLRGGWGKTGNQEFPSGSSQRKYGLGNNGSIAGQVTNFNPDLKWQSDKQYNIGIDIAVLKNRLTATFDYFNKATTDLLYPTVPIQPAPPGSVVTWKNLAGKIENKGVEGSINASLLSGADFTLDLGVNATYIKNNVTGLSGRILTGILDGQGISGTTVQVIQSGLPINAFFTRHFEGFDKTSGQSIYTDQGNTFFYEGNPNPKTTLGLNLNAAYKKLSLVVNMYGAFGQKIYNNTFNNVISVGNIRSGRNIAVSVYENSVKEAFSNPVTASSRYIENGSYLKMANATLTYALGKIGNIFSNSTIYVTGQNLFTITKFDGFDPEVNVDKSVNGTPSVGIEYQPYPSARTITFGLNLSL